MALPAELETLDTASLAAKLDEIQRNNEYLKKENATLESYLHRHVTPEEAEEWADEDARRGRKGKGKKHRAATLTIDQKLDIVTAEQDALKKEITAAETQSTRMIDALKAMLEQTDLRIAALKREAYEFKRDVVIGGQHPRNGRTMAEKVVKYFEDQIRAKDALADKLRLKNQTLRGVQAKLESSLRQKEEAGDVLHYIDFHQLQIENKQHLARIEERNNELLRLKLSTGQTVQSLNGMKSKLSDAARAIVRLRAEMRARTTLLGKLQAENASLSEAVARAQERAEAMVRAARAATDLPTVLDYIELTALQTGLHSELTAAARKLEIAELTAHQATLKAQQAGLPVPSLAATVAPLPQAVLTMTMNAGKPGSAPAITPAGARGGPGLKRAGSSSGLSGAHTASSASSAASSAASDDGGTRRSGRLLDADIFGAGGATGGSSISPAAAMLGLATPGGHSAGGAAGRRGPGSSASSVSSLPSGPSRTPAPAGARSAAGGRTGVTGTGAAFSPLAGGATAGAVGLSMTRTGGLPAAPVGAASTAALLAVARSTHGGAGTMAAATAALHASVGAAAAGAGPGLGRAIGGHGTARSPGAGKQAFVPGQSAPLPTSIAGFGGAGAGHLRLGRATTGKPPQPVSAAASAVPSRAASAKPGAR